MFEPHEPDIEIKIHIKSIIPVYVISKLTLFSLIATESSPSNSAVDALVKLSGPKTGRYS